MPVINVVSDASVALEWFRAEGEEEVGPARALVTAHREREIALFVLDLTAYEVGNALLRGRANATPGQVATVLQGLDVICPAIRPDQAELTLATQLAAGHDLTIYDAAYAAVAASRDATLATLDGALLRAGFGQRPSEIVSGLRRPGG